MIVLRASRAASASASAAAVLLPAPQRRLAGLACAMSVDTPPAARAAAVPGIEVERKFLLPDDPESMEALRERILGKGGSLIKQICFTDSYYDSPTFVLTLADHWLRQRDGAWELKVPGQHVGGTAVYTELETEPEIAALLAQQLLQQQHGSPSVSLAELVEQHRIEPCATFGTTRESYSLPGGYHVDLVSRTALPASDASLSAYQSRDSACARTIAAASCLNQPDMTVDYGDANGSIQSECTWCTYRTWRRLGTVLARSK